jgi:hypothetical protein
MLGGLQGEGEPGHSAADDEEVEALGHAPGRLIFTSPGNKDVS